MPEITDERPKAVEAELAGLRASLDKTLPTRELDKNLLIGTWNIRAFGDLTEKWNAGEGDSPKRDLRALTMIKEIVSRFDVLAVQEVRGNIKALRHMMRALGPNWAFTLTDVTRGTQGNDERLAFVFDTRRVKPSGLAGELVIPPEWERRVGKEALREQFARTPYAVSFSSGGQTVILVTLHVLYGSKDDVSGRKRELGGIAEWLDDWATETNSWGQNLIALGDFNIDRAGDPLFEAFTSTGLRPPDELNDTPRTITDSAEKHHFYDQIAWFHSNGRSKLSLGYTGRAGGVDFRGVVMPDLGSTELSWKMSDHLALWTEFAL